MDESSRALVGGIMGVRVRLQCSDPLDNEPHEGEGEDNDQGDLFAGCEGEPVCHEAMESLFHGSAAGWVTSRQY